MLCPFHIAVSGYGTKQLLCIIGLVCSMAYQLFKATLYIYIYIYIKYTFVNPFC